MGPMVLAGRDGHALARAAALPVGSGGVEQAPRIGDQSSGAPPGPAAPMTVAGKQYPADHWLRLEPSDELLLRYVDANERGYNRAKAVIIRRLLGDLTDRTVLDYGGGAGYMSVVCAEGGARVTLV